MNEIEKVTKSLGIEVGKPLTVEQMQQIIQMQIEGTLKVDQLKQIAAITKNFTGVAIEASKALYQTAASARDVKKSALDALAKSIDVLEKIIEKSNDAEVHDKVIAALEKIGERIERMDQRNDNFFWNVAKVIGLIGVGAIGLMSARNNQA